MKFKYIIGLLPDLNTKVSRKEAFRAFKRGEDIAIVLEQKIIRMNAAALNNFRVKGLSLNRMRLHCFIDAHRKLIKSLQN